MHILSVFYLYFRGKIPQKGAYPLQIPISNDCIYAFLVNRNQLLGDAVLVILLVIPRYQKYIILDSYNDPFKVSVWVIQPI